MVRQKDVGLRNGYRTLLEAAIAPEPKGTASFLNVNFHLDTAFFQLDGDILVCEARQVDKLFPITTLEEENVETVPVLGDSKLAILCSRSNGTSGLILYRF